MNSFKTEIQLLYVLYGNGVELLMGIRKKAAAVIKSLLPVLVVQNHRLVQTVRKQLHRAPQQALAQPLPVGMLFKTSANGQTFGQSIVKTVHMVPKFAKLRSQLFLEYVIPPVNVHFPRLTVRFSTFLTMGTVRGVLGVQRIVLVPLLQKWPFGVSGTIHNALHEHFCTILAKVYTN